MVVKVIMVVMAIVIVVVAKKITQKLHGNHGRRWPWPLALPVGHWRLHLPLAVVFVTHCAADSLHR